MNDSQAAVLKTQNANLRAYAVELKGMMRGAQKELRSAFSAEGQATADALGLFGGLATLVTTDVVVGKLKPGKYSETIKASVPTLVGAGSWLVGLAMPLKSAPSPERQAARVFATVLFSHGLYRFGSQIAAWWQKPKALPPSQPAAK